MTEKYPLPEGFTIRPATMDDLDEAMELLAACSIEMVGAPEYDRAVIENEWQTPGLNQETDQRVVFSPEGKLVGYAEVWTIGDNPVHPWVWGRVHPEYKNLGIGSHMLAWSEQRCAQVIDSLPPEARVAYRSSAISNFQPSNDLLIDHGLQLIRQSFQMRIEMDAPPPAPVWPEGIELRIFRMEDAKAVYLADDDAFKDHFGYVEESFETGFEHFSHHFFDHEDFDPNFWFLAMDGDEIAGVCLCRPKSHEDAEMGWVSSLGVRRPWRKRGIGLALLQHAFGAFWQAGQKKAGLGVDAESLTGALKLYKQAGMHVQRQYNLYEKELRPGEELSTVTITAAADSD